MTSQLEQAIITIIASNYSSLVIVTVVSYDYILTFSREIDYIWKKPWALVSTLFVLIRYLGVFNAITAVFGGVILRFSFWAFWAFICAVELVMILRVWALYNRSRLVLGALLGLYAIEAISLFLYYVFPSISLQVVVTEVSPLSVCEATSAIPATWLLFFPFILMIVLGTSMCLLTAIQFVKELFQVYKVTNGFHQNRYMKRLTMDGMVYFVVICAISIFALLVVTGIQADALWTTVVAAVLQLTLPTTLAPRFILSLRELYAHEVRMCNIDTAFGFGSESVHMDSVRSAIQFADARQESQDESGEQGDEIQMEDRIQDSRHVESRA